MKEKKKLGFTLAEVLITLGVIGVVAAMTLPTVIHKIQMAVLQTQFKKTYSTLSNAVEKTRVDTEYSLKCSSSNISDCKVFNDKFESQFKVIKVCTVANAYNNECFGYIRGINFVTPDKNSSTYPSNYLLFYEVSLRGNKNNYTFATAGGFSVGYYNKKERGIYLIDTNGPKGPNKWGYDVFSLRLNAENTKLICTEKLNNFFEKDGKSCIDMLTNEK